MRYTKRQGVVSRSSNQPTFAEQYPYLIPPAAIAVSDFFATHSVGALALAYPPVPAIGAPQWHNAITGTAVNVFSASGVSCAAPTSTGQTGCYLDVGEADHQVMGLFQAGATGTAFGLIARWQASTQRVHAVLRGDTNVLQIQSVDGSATALASKPMTLIAGERYAMRAAIAGDDIAVAAWHVGSDDDPVIVEASATAFAGATTCGLYFTGVPGDGSDHRCLEFYAA